MSTPAPQDDTLRTLTKGSAVKVVVKDTEGKEHELQPLDLSDIVEYEDRVGQSILDVNKPMKLRDIAFLVYLSLRKEGCTKKDIEERNFKYTERQVSMMFDMGFFRQSVTILLDILKVSGFKVADPKEEGKEGAPNPTKDSPASVAPGA